MIQIQQGDILKGPFWQERVKVIFIEAIGENQIRIKALSDILPKIGKVKQRQ